MAVTAQTLVDEFLSQWGFDVSQAEALVWLDRRHKKMVRRSRCNLRSVSVGVTVAGQADYTFEALEVKQVLVDGVPYAKAPRLVEAEYPLGTVSWTPTGRGLFVATADADGVHELGLVPTPDTAGLAIEAFAAMPADTLALGSPLLVPEDFHGALQQGMAADGYERDAEQTVVADRNEARFDVACEELRAEAKRRGRSGPAQIRMR